MGGISRAASLAFMLQLMSCLLQGGRSQSINANPTFPVAYFQGTAGEDVDDFSCLCSNNGAETFTQLEWVHNDTVIKSTIVSVCIPFKLDFQGSLEFTDAGEYFCRGNLSDGTVLSTNPTMLNIIDPAVIVAPPRQFALQHSNATLNCTNTLTTTIAAIQWLDNGTRITSPIFSIFNADLRNEATYVCEVFLAAYSLITTRDIEFLVIVPPIISSQPPTLQSLTGNPSLTLEVGFQSRFQENTVVSWFHNGSVIPSNRIQTEVLPEAPNAVTRLSFDPILRRDRGVYRVVIENDFHLIPSDMRAVETSFQVNVNVPPATPSDLTVETVSVTLYRVTWVLTNETADAGADILTLTVDSSNTTTEYILLDGSDTQTTIDVEPGMEYQLFLTAQNQDGTTTTSPLTFSTPPTAPSTPSLIGIVRVNETAYNLTVGVAYTGGGAITHFTVSFRQSGSNAGFTLLDDVPASPTSPDSTLEWNGVATSQAFRNGGPFEFEITINNAAGLNTDIPSTTESLILPGAPLQPKLLSFTITSLTLAVELPRQGTVPFTTVFFEIKFPITRTANITGRYYRGEVVQFTLTGLEEATDYIVEVYVTNDRGNGPSSPEAAFRTDSMDTSLPVWVIAVIAASIVITALIALMIVALIGRYCYTMRQTRKQYYVSSPARTADDKTLDASHEMVNRPRKPANFSPLGSGPLTPRGPLDIGGPPNGFLYDTSSANDSEDSYPRYYTVSTSPGDSMPSLATRITSSHSTRESLVYPPAPPANSTNV